MTSEHQEGPTPAAGAGVDGEWADFAVELDVPLSGVRAGRWHAVRHRDHDTADAPADEPVVEFGRSACGRRVQIARRFERFDPDRFPEWTCAECAWTVAIGAGTLPARYRHLASIGDGSSVLAVRVAQAIVAAQLGNGEHTVEAMSVEGIDEGELSYTVVLLATVSAHAPTVLVAADCARGDCDCPYEQDQEFEGCPPVMVACLGCSPQIERRVDEPECLVECTIAAPCEVLRTLATFYGIPHTGAKPGIDAASFDRAGGPSC